MGLRRGLLRSGVRAHGDPADARDDGPAGAARRVDHIRRRAALCAALCDDDGVGPDPARRPATRRPHHVGACLRLLSRRGALAWLAYAWPPVRGAGMIEAIQACAARYAADRPYTPVGQVFHWTLAASLLFQLRWGW